MPSRDPQTGQFVSGGGSSGISYADHDVHWVRHSARYLSTADSGPDTGVTTEEEFEVTERGLDPDEIAQLRGFYVNVSFDQPGSITDQDEAGVFRAQIGAGFNLRGEEFLLGTSSVEQVDVDDSGTDDFAVRTRDTDEVGQLFSARLGGGMEFSDTTDGTGAGGFFPYISDYHDLAARFGTGPYVDAADDWTSRIRLDVNNAVEDVTCTVVYGLYYSVEMMEGGRTRFGR